MDVSSEHHQQRLHGDRGGIAMILEVSKETPLPLSPTNATPRHAGGRMATTATSLEPQSDTMASSLMPGAPASNSKRKRKPQGTSDLTMGPESSGRAWTKDHDQKLRAAVAAIGPRNWKAISEETFNGLFTDTQCLNRWYKVLRPGLVKGPWTKEEDDIIMKCMSTGITKWSEIADRIPGRLGKQCRERWLNHLDPTLKKGDWTKDEDAILLRAQAKWGNSWTRIAELLPGRSENAVKNRWNSASHTRSRCAPRAPGVAALDRKEAHERQAVRDYCVMFEEGHSLSEYIPWVTSRLEAVCPEYSTLDGSHVSRLHQRLRELLDEEVLDYSQDSAIYRAVMRKKSKPSMASTDMPRSRPAAAALHGRKSVGAMASGRSGRGPHGIDVELHSRMMVMGAAEEEKADEEHYTSAMDASMTMSADGVTMKLGASRASTFGKAPRAGVKGSAAHGAYGRMEEEYYVEEEEEEDHSVSSISSISTVSEEGDVKQPAGGLSGNGHRHHHHQNHSKGRIQPPAAGSTKKRGPLPAPSHLATNSKAPKKHHNQQHQHPQHQQQLHPTQSQAPPQQYVPQHRPAPAITDPSKSRLRDVISLLFSAMRKERDPIRRGLYQDALDAATQELPAMVNFVEGVLGGSSSTLDLDLEADRQFLLESIITATQRGIFR